MSRSHPGPVVRLLRTASGLSLRGLAREVGVSPTYMHQVETAQGAPPSAERLEQVARALGVPAGHLFDVAGTFEPELIAWLKATPEARAFLGAARDCGLDPFALVDAARVLRAGGDLGVRSGDDADWQLAGTWPGDEVTATSEAPSSPLPLEGLIVPDRVLMATRAGSRTTALERLARHAAKGIEGLTAKDLGQVLVASEQEASSAIGRGAALAHAWIDGLQAPEVWLARLQRPVGWDAPDSEPVDMVVLCLSPASEREAHVARLARLASVLTDDGTVRMLAAAQTADDIAACFLVADSRRG